MTNSVIDILNYHGPIPAMTISYSLENAIMKFCLFYR